MSSGKWAHVKRVTAADIQDDRVINVKPPIHIGGAVQQVTIGAKAAAGAYDQRLAYTTAEVMQMARFLQFLAAKTKSKAK